MYLISNQQRRAGLLVKKLKDKEETDYKLIKRLKDELKEN